MGLSDVEVAIAAARAGANVVKSRYGTTLERIAKSSLDFATDADIEAERSILNVLRGERPGDELVGEESGDVRERLSGRTWLVDPLCGTLNFAAHTPLFGVNVALKDGAKTVTAVTVDPNSGEVMWTEGNRSYVRDGEVEVEMRPSATSTLVDVNLDGPFANAKWFRAVDVVSAPTFTRFFRPRVSSTSLALAWVALGRRSGYITDWNQPDSVHLSSGIALCQGADCTVSNLLGGELFTGVGGLIAASDARTHERLVGIVNEQFLRFKNARS